MDQLPGSRKKLARGLPLAICALPLVYVGIYIILSTNGKYAPEIVGVQGVKSYVWAPAGFYDADHPWEGSVGAKISNTTVYGGWNKFVETLFYPLWQLDARYIHKPT